MLRVLWTCIWLRHYDSRKCYSNHGHEYSGFRIQRNEAYWRRWHGCPDTKNRLASEGGLILC